jgi:HAL2 family 3'(2'),5'-bisphosphate nucleotidase
MPRLTRDVTLLFRQHLTKFHKHMKNYANARLRDRLLDSDAKRRMDPNVEEDMARLLAAAKAAVRAACRVTATVQAGAFSHVSKLDSSPVTVADFAAQAIVTIVLQRELALPPGVLLMMGEEDVATFRGAGREVTARVAQLVQHTIPKAAFLASAESASGGDDDAVWSVEEVTAAIGAGGYAGKQRADSSPPFWVLDPVDGTKGFLRRGQYAVGLAYVVRGAVSLAVIGCPNLPYPSLLDGRLPGSMSALELAAEQAVPSADAAVHVGTLCSAVAGGGAFQEALEQSAEEAAAAPTRLRVSGVMPSSPNFIIAQSFERTESDAAASDHIRHSLSIACPVLRVDSMVKYCLVARGEAAAYFRLLAGTYREFIWDHAPGSLLVAEAGGTSSDAYGSALDFSHGQRLTENVGILASNGAVHAAIVDALRQTLPGVGCR